MTRVSILMNRLQAWPWSHWKSQVTGIIRLEMKRNLFSRRSFFLVLLAMAPVAILFLRIVFPEPERALQGLGGANVLFAVIYRTFLLRLIIFFGCVGMFMRLYRGDILERTLHYYYLCPVRREVLMVGKFLAGTTITFLCFSICTVVSYVLMFVPGGSGSVESFVLYGAGKWHLLAYLGVTLLACVGYGAVFILAGLLVKNPIVPAGVILGWEYMNFLMPPTLKKFSVIYYLESLCPVPIPTGPITILAEPAPFWMAVPGILGLTVLLLAVAAWRTRRMEVSYAEE